MATQAKTAAAKKAPKTPKAAKKATPARPKTTRSADAAEKSAKKSLRKSLKKSAKKSAGKDPKKGAATIAAQPLAQILTSTIAFEGPLFRIHREHIVEPGGRDAWRDVIRHNGSVVILAVDSGKGKDRGKDHSKDRKDPWIVIERQYRHATGQYLWELPAGKLDRGEDPLHGAQRELAEETGYAALRWSKLIYYYPSPGFLGEGMHIFLAEGLIPGEAHPEEDEKIDFRLVRLSELLEKIRKGSILDGKTLVGALLYAQMLQHKPRKK